MTKAEIVTEIAKATGEEKTVVSAVVEQFMECVKQNMIGGEPVYLRGFGSFILKLRAEKTARNISKGTTLTIPAHKVPAFKPAQSFALKLQSNSCSRIAAEEYSQPTRKRRTEALCMTAPW